MFFAFGMHFERPSFIKLPIGFFAELKGDLDQISNDYILS